ncbi:hypothetical protein PA25_18030 [Pseudoalteromonas sp. A25]|uniref:tRNA 2-thiouridine-synthesizing protein n=1 Tax=Pseudoalteromonas sp. A25 TaxID=116092 RepID=UPI0012608423|nr:tRNA 2-thiouridine-synthesizing protein [Pseudoalteromonas sp. A25]BBN81818.1 hypothetical protein PA25_18030 [Pseudoalteromonas sp. A25]
MSIGTIHIFSKPASYYNSLQIEQLLANNDVVLLTADACYDHATYRQLPAKGYMLSHCALARGIATDYGYTLIDDNEWVTLIDNAEKSITW